MNNTNFSFDKSISKTTVYYFMINCVEPTPIFEYPHIYLI